MRRRLTKKQKKALVEEAIYEVMASYQPGQAMHVPLHELTSMPTLPADVFMDDYCETPMRYLGTTETVHEFGCDNPINKAMKI